MRTNLSANNVEQYIYFLFCLQNFQSQINGHSVTSNPVSPFACGTNNSCIIHSLKVQMKTGLVK